MALDVMTLGARPLRLFRPFRQQTASRLVDDPAYAEVGSGFSARVVEGAAALRLLAAIPMDGAEAALVLSVESALAVKVGDLLLDASHPAGSRVWKVETVTMKGPPIPRAVLSASRQLKPPQEVR